MKKIVLIVLAAIVLASRISLAQELPIGDARNESFRRYFQEIVRSNPNIPDFQKMAIGTGYVLADGTSDELGPNDRNGIWGREFQKWYGISYGEFLDGQKPTTTPPPAPVKDPALEAGKNPPPPPQTGFNWLWLLVIVAIAAALYLAYLLHSARRMQQERDEADRANRLTNEEAARARVAREAELNRNPITSGPPMVPGGVNPANHAAVRENMRNVAARSYAARNGGVMPALDRVEIVSPIVQGNLYDVWGVRYAGQPEFVDRRFNGERGFQAMVSVNGEPPTLETWAQECGNDLRFGTRYRGGRFVPIATDQPIPAAEPQRVAAMRVVPAEEAGSSATIVWGTMQYTVRNGTLNVELDKKSGEIIGFEADGHVRTSPVAKASRPKAVTEPRTSTAS